MLISIIPIIIRLRVVPNNGNTSSLIVILVTESLEAYDKVLFFLLPFAVSNNRSRAACSNSFARCTGCTSGTSGVPVSTSIISICVLNCPPFLLIKSWRSLGLEFRR